jgi:Zn finger protein HypA/HybF involved in hydrogenase expression
MKENHKHKSVPEVECEKCGGEVKVLNSVYPNTFECVCKKCKHRFNWISTGEEFNF